MLTSVLKNPISLAPARATKSVVDIENQKCKLCWKKAEPKKSTKRSKAMKAMKTMKAAKRSKAMKAMKTMKAMKKTTGKAKNPMKAAKSSPLSS